MSHAIRPIAWAVLPKGDKLYSECATVVTIEDEAAGEFVAVKSQADPERPNTIIIDAEEWPRLREAIDNAFAEISEHQNRESTK